MRTIRFLKAATCGACAGAILWFCCAVFLVLIDHLSIALGSKDKFPEVTKWVAALVPEQEWLMLSGIALFAFGYACVAWLDEPTPLVCVMHGFALVVFSITICGIFPWASVIQGTHEPNDPAAGAPSLEPARDMPWLAACSIPLLVAVLSILVRGRAVRDRSGAIGNP